MSRVRARSAATAPTKNIDADQKITGRLSSNWKTSLRRPKGIGRSRPRMSRPMWEYIVIATAKTRATMKRLRMSTAMAAIDPADIPAMSRWS